MGTENILQIHIPIGEDYEQIVGYEVEVDSLEYRQNTDTRLLLLSKGGDIDGDPNRTYTIQGSEDGSHQRVIIPDTNTAIGYFLQGCETSGVREDVAHKHLSEEAPHLFRSYSEWNSNLSPRDRRLRLMDLAELRIDDGDFAAERYFEENSTWRSINLNDSATELAKEITRTIDPKYAMCYWTAQNAALKHIDNHRVEYVEGLCIPKQAGQCIRHAWIEIDGEVAEVTWPWHFFGGEEAEYFGVNIPKEEVKEARDRRDINGALVLTDDEVKNIGKKMGSS